jgi:hypothetical protein
MTSDNLPQNTESRETRFRASKYCRKLGCVVALGTSIALAVFSQASRIAAEQPVANEGAPQKGTPAVELLPHEQQFVDQLTGAILVGHFSIAGRDDKGQQPERYEIASVEKLADRKWLITSRIKYGKHDVNVPVPIMVDWAGTTPVMSLDEVTVPLLGTFSTRVLLDKDRYAGTWQHDAVGGHLWGRIERATKVPSAE